MANRVETIFQTVLDALGAPPEQDADAGDWLDDSPFDRPFDDGDDRIDTLDSDDTIERVTRRMTSQRAVNPLPPDQQEAAEASVRQRGFDVLAFYKSRRHVDKRPYRGKWGVFYLRQGLTFVADKIAHAHPGYRDPRLLAHDFLQAHEWFHFRADLQTLMFEATTGRHLHGPVRQLFRGHQDDFVEEALANRQVWDWSKRGVVGLRDFAFDFMKLQPGAYARFDERRLQLAGEWAANVVDQQRAAARPDLAHWVEASPRDLIGRSMCPEYVVKPARLDTWWPAALVPPPVEQIVDDEAVIKFFRKSKDQQLAVKWQLTKGRLISDRYGNGLNFKPWKPEPPAWSVKVDDGFRAHLKPEGQGVWRAYKIGPHTAMGHD